MAMEEVAYLSKEQIEQYHDQGFLVVEGLFGADTLQKIDAWLNRVAAKRADYPNGMFVMEDVPEEEVKHLPPLGAVRKINSLNNEPEAMQFFGPDSPAARMSAQLAGRSELLMIFLSAFAKPANVGSSTPWHQDQALWNFFCPEFLSCWIALDPCTKENGYLQFYRGGHTESMLHHVMHEGAPHPYIPEQLLDKSRIVAVPMNAGDAVFFGGMIPHFSEPNRSPARRIGMPVVYGTEKDLKNAINLSRWIKLRQAAQLNYQVGEPFLHSRNRVSPH